MKMCVRHNLLKSVREKGRTSHENRQRPTSIPYNKSAERPAVVPAVCTAHSLAGIYWHLEGHQSLNQTFTPSHKHLGNNYNISPADNVSVCPSHLLFTATHRTDAAVLHLLHPSRCTFSTGQAMSRNMTICAVATKTHEDGKITSARPASLPSEKTQRGRPEKQNPPPCAQPDRQRIRRAAGQGTIYNPITILILFSDTTDLLPEGNPSCHFYA